jgi:hypothetical protein
VQDQLASGTEPFARAERADTFTYHFGHGRGVRRHDKPRCLLWYARSTTSTIEATKTPNDCSTLADCAPTPTRRPRH